MEQRYIRLSLVLSIVTLLIVFFSGCIIGGDNNRITLGPEVDVATVIIEPSGGTIKVEKPDNPLDGLEI